MMTETILKFLVIWIDMKNSLHTITPVDFYKKAKDEVIVHGYDKEVDWATKVRFDKMTLENFSHEYVWVVCNSGMRNQVAKKIFDRFMKSGDLKYIGHPHKKHSIKTLFEKGKEWFDKLKSYDTTEQRLEYLETLPHIGPITKYHLAKNLGIQVAKPDRHLVRLAKHFDFKTAQELCEFISKHVGDNIITVDVVLWRYSNLFGTVGLGRDDRIE